TPWGGHKAAESGLRHLKKPVPSWLDVAPDSDFLTKLYSVSLPKGTKHYLIYGAKPGGPFWMKDENDGVVTVESQTDSRVARSASSVTKYTYDHEEILNQKDVLARVQKYLGE